MIDILIIVYLTVALFAAVFGFMDSILNEKFQLTVFKLIAPTYILLYFLTKLMCTPIGRKK